MMKKCRLADRIISVCGAASFDFIDILGFIFDDILTTL